MSLYARLLPVVSGEREPGGESGHAQEECWWCSKERDAHPASWKLTSHGAEDDVSSSQHHQQEARVGMLCSESLGAVHPHLRRKGKRR